MSMLLFLNSLHSFDKHVLTKPESLFNPFPNFNFTGSLRPVYPLSAKRVIPSSIPHPDYAADGIPKTSRALLRPNKVELLDAKAQEGMRVVCGLAREVLDIAAAALRPGITTDEIDEIVHKACIERNVCITTMVRCFCGALHRLTLPALVVPVAPQLQPLPQVCVHLCQRDHLPRHSR